MGEARSRAACVGPGRPSLLAQPQFHEGLAVGGESGLLCADRYCRPSVDGERDVLGGDETPETVAAAGGQQAEDADDLCQVQRVGDRPCGERDERPDQCGDERDTADGADDRAAGRSHREHEVLVDGAREERAQDCRTDAVADRVERERTDAEVRVVDRVGAGGVQSVVQAGRAGDDADAEQAVHQAVHQGDDGQGVVGRDGTAGQLAQSTDHGTPPD